MPVLSLASPDEVRAILSETHEIWSEGMTLEDYIAFVFAQMESPWGRENFRYLVWKEGAVILSSLKLYRLQAQCDSRMVSLEGIGAVYTPRAHRGRGHARAMLAAVLERLRAEAVEGALLFSDIGHEYYRQLGFHPLPSHEFSLKLAELPERGSPGLQVEQAQGGEWSDIERLYEEAIASAPFALRRPSSYWDHLRLKERERARRLPGRSKAFRPWIVWREGKSVGYALVLLDSPKVILLEWILGDRSAETAQTLLAAIRREGEALGGESLVGWWPPHPWSEFLPNSCHPPRPRTQEVAMLAPLSPGLDPRALAAWGDLFWKTDHF